MPVTLCSCVQRICALCDALLAAPKRGRPSLVSGPQHGCFDQTADALRRLRTVVQAEFARHRQPPAASSLPPPPAAKRRGKQKLSRSFLYNLDPSERAALYRQRSRRAAQKLREANTEIAKNSLSKAVGYRMSKEWIMRVMLAAPHASSR